jgi:hypothetical protein
MPKSLLFFGGSLAIITTALTGMVSQAQIIAPGTSVTPSGLPSGVPGSSEKILTPTKKPLASTIATFNCQSRAGQTKVVLKSDRTYKTGANPYPPISGSYQKIGDAYRFKDGSFKKQSLVKLRTSYYLVATDKEARAASLAAVDAAFICTKK